MFIFEGFYDVVSIAIYGFYGRGQRVTLAIVAIVVFRRGLDALPRWVMALAVLESESPSL